MNSELHNLLASKSVELQTDIVFIARQFFDETKGAKCVFHLAIKQSSIVDQLSTKLFLF